MEMNNGEEGTGLSKGNLGERGKIEHLEEMLQA
jgi:hypothetical protein